ncbi:MAG: 6-pyruvoyl trahydropterin synthase family protein [Halobacteriota archaeon]
MTVSSSMWIEIDGWQAKLRFSACHFIPDHPKCGYLHGHTYAVSVRVIGVQSGDFVMDFEELKRHVSEICEPLDHRVLLASMDSDVQIRKIDEDHISALVGKQAKRYVFPAEDVVLLPINSASAEDLCSYFLDQLSGKLDGDHIKEIHVRLDEGLGQGAGCSRCLSASSDILR